MMKFEILFVIFFVIGCTATPVSTDKPIAKFINSKSVNCFETDSFKMSNEINQKIKYIVNYLEEHTDFNKEINDRYADTASNLILDLVYNYKDEQITLKQKLDLILLLKYYQRHGTYYYIGKVFNRNRDGFEVRTKNSMLLIPLLDGIGDSLVLDIVLKEDSFLCPNEYCDYTRKMIDLLEERTKYKNSDFTSKKDYNFKTLNYDIIFSKRFIKQYSLKPL